MNEYMARLFPGKPFRQNGFSRILFPEVPGRSISVWRKNPIRIPVPSLKHPHVGSLRGF